MSTVLKAAEAEASWSPEPSRPLDEAVWSAWLAKNRAEEQRGAAAGIWLLKLVGLLLVGVALFFLVASSGITKVLVAIAGNGMSA
jgi:hypothetical protein